MFDACLVALLLQLSCWVVVNVHPFWFSFVRGALVTIGLMLWNVWFGLLCSCVGVLHWGSFKGIPCWSQFVRELRAMLGYLGAHPSGVFQNWQRCLSRRLLRLI